MHRRYEFRRWLTRFLKALGVMLLPMVAFGASFVIIASLNAFEGCSYAFALLPAPLCSFLGILSILDLSDPLCYLCRMMFLPMAACSILWLLEGARLLNRELACGLGEWFFSQPGGRSWLVWKRWLGGLGGIVLNLVLLAGLTSLLFLVCFSDADLSRHSVIWLVYARMLPSHLLCWSIGTAASALFVSPRKSTGFALSVFLLFTLLTFIPASTGALPFLWDLSPLHFSIPEYTPAVGPYFTPGQILCFAGLVLVSTLLSWLLLRSRQIDCSD